MPYSQDDVSILKAVYDETRQQLAGAASRLAAAQEMLAVTPAEHLDRNFAIMQARAEHEAAEARNKSAFVRWDEARLAHDRDVRAQARTATARWRLPWQNH